MTQIPPKPLANATIPIPKNITQNTSLPTNSTPKKLIKGDENKQGPLFVDDFSQSSSDDIVNEIN